MRQNRFKYRATDVVMERRGEGGVGEHYLHGAICNCGVQHLGVDDEKPPKRRIDDSEVAKEIVRFEAALIATRSAKPVCVRPLRTL